MTLDSHRHFWKYTDEEFGGEREKIMAANAARFYGILV